MRKIPVALKILTFFHFLNLIGIMSWNYLINEPEKAIFWLILLLWNFQCVLKYLD